MEYGVGRGLTVLQRLRRSGAAIQLVKMVAGMWIQGEHSSEIWFDYIMLWQISSFILQLINQDMIFFFGM